MGYEQRNFEGCIERKVFCDEHGEIEVAMIYRHDLSELVQNHRKMHHEDQRDVQKVRIIETHTVVTPVRDIIVPFPSDGVYR